MNAKCLHEIREVKGMWVQCLHCGKIFVNALLCEHKNIKTSCSFVYCADCGKVLDKLKQSGWTLDTKKETT